MRVLLRGFGAFVYDRVQISFKINYVCSLRGVGWRQGIPVLRVRRGWEGSDLGVRVVAQDIDSGLYGCGLEFGNSGVAVWGYRVFRLDRSESLGFGYHAGLEIKAFRVRGLKFQDRRVQACGGGS